MDINPIIPQKNIQRPSATMNEAAAEKAGKEFEAVFIGEMLKPMFQGLKTDGLFGGGFAEEMNRSMLIDEYAAHITDAGGLGIAAHVKAELLRLQEKVN